MLLVKGPVFYLVRTALVFVFLFAQHADAKLAPCWQDEEATDDTNLESLVRQWEELDSELADKEFEFNLATQPDKQKDIRGQYEALVEQSNSLVENIKEKAVEALDSGAIDETTSKLLVGIIMNDVEFERNNEATMLGDKLISAGIDGSLFETAAKSNRLSVYSKELLEELFVRFNQQKQGDLPQIKIETTKGMITVELFEDEAPNTVANFVSLVENKFYDGLKFHRVIEGFVAQGGDPDGDGSGGPGYSINCECESPEARRHFLGSLSMAHAGKDSGGSQFFFCLDRTSQLDGKHTVFGRVIDGIETLNKLSRNYTTGGKIPNSDTDSIQKMEVVRKRDHEYEPKKAGDEVADEEIEQPPAQPETINDQSDSSEDEDQSESKSAEPAAEQPDEGG